MMKTNKLLCMTTALCVITPYVKVNAATLTQSHQEASRQNSKKHTSQETKFYKKDSSKKSANHSLPMHRKNSDPIMAADTETINVTTGTHSTNRKARQSTAPVTIVSAATLTRSGQMNLADALTRTYASINVVAMGADSAALTSSIQMRGLGPVMA